MSGLLPALNQPDVGFLPAEYRNRQRFSPKLLSEIAYSVKKANIGSRTTIKCMKMGNLLAFCGAKAKTDNVSKAFQNISVLKQLLRRRHIPGAQDY